LIGCASVACLLGKGGRQRTDATHVQVAVRDLHLRDPHRLEQVIRTLRAALEALAVVAPAWLGGLLPHQWDQPLRPARRRLAAAHLRAGPRRTGR
jgi:hypothetical protein